MQTVVHHGIAAQSKARVSTSTSVPPCAPVGANLGTPPPSRPVPPPRRVSHVPRCRSRHHPGPDVHPAAPSCSPRLGYCSLRPWGAAGSLWNAPAAHIGPTRTRTGRPTGGQTDGRVIPRDKTARRHRAQPAATDKNTVRIWKIRRQTSRTARQHMDEVRLGGTVA